ncbi:Xaa-Pro peptidase family protein [Lacrimispora sp. NSJ-141]|uniref:Xaa-Pro peptidase family protein n=1 Tax=Lientehia hominis TaxID=2897778 RepID=A0AAP2W8T5_9FIRM|nr:Xaa-Pro peptidase family protein [Lientehia hominis]MCD2492565.1 Xaa-Pro peptidase family protein [Lientehia hominis]
MSQKEIGFSMNEFQARVQKVKASMAEQRLDMLLVNTPENIFYLTGHKSPGYYMYMCLVLPMEGEMTLVLRRGEVGNASVYSWLEGGGLVAYDDTDDPLQKTVDVILEKGFKGGCVGVEFTSWFLTTKNFLGLKEKLAGAQITDASGTVEEARMIKSPKEIEYIEECCRIADMAMAKGMEKVRPGNKEKEVAAAFFSEMCLQGSEYYGTEPYVASGPRAGAMHSSWGERIIQSGESVLLELAATVNRYNGALMRTVHLGKPSPLITEWTKVCIEALNAAIDAIKPGVTSEYVDAACCGVIERAGLYENYRKRTGYSLGIAFAPDWGEGHIMSLQKGDKRLLQPGMVFHMPPALRELDAYGVGFSETVLVTETGCKVLGNTKRELLVID